MTQTLTAEFISVMYTLNKVVYSNSGRYCCVSGELKTCFNVFVQGACNPQLYFDVCYQIFK